MGKLILLLKHWFGAPKLVHHGQRTLNDVLRIELSLVLIFSIYWHCVKFQNISNRMLLQIVCLIFLGKASVLLVVYPGLIVITDLENLQVYLTCNARILEWIMFRFQKFSHLWLNFIWIKDRRDRLHSFIISTSLTFHDKHDLLLGHRKWEARRQNNTEKSRLVLRILNLLKSNLTRELPNDT